MAKPIDDAYYRNVRGLPLATRLGYAARRKTYDLFVKSMRPDASTRILDIGVSDEVVAPAANILEILYPHPDHIVCAGLSDGEAVMRAYPGVRYTRIRTHAALPFSDREFDIAYSNAVLEHVGCLDQQRQFIAEACRVGKQVFIVVPNRLFPVEVHTGIPFVHYLPKPVFRAILRGTRFDFWSHESNLNYLSPATLLTLYGPHEAVVHYAGIGFGPFRSNLACYTTVPSALRGNHTELLKTS